MPEGESIQGELTPVPDVDWRTKRADAEQRRSRLTERLIIAAAVIAVATMGLYLALYWSTGVWQTGVRAGVLALGMVCLIPAWVMARRQELEWAAVMSFAAVAFAFGGGEVAWSGGTLYTLISAVLLIGLVGSVTIPRRWGLTAAAIVVYGAWTLFVVLAQPISRYDINQSPVLRVYVPAASAAIVLVTVVQIAHAFRFGTIRTRLLIAFAAVALLVAVATGVTSAAVTLQNGQRQTMNQLESATTLKQREIQAWLDALASDMTILLNTERTAENAQVVLQVSPTFGSYEYARQQLTAHFQAHKQQTGRMEELFILDTQGRVVLSTDPSREGQVAADQAYATKGLFGPYVSPPSYSPELGRTIVVLARPLTNAQGAVFGVLAGRPNMEPLNAILAERSGLGKTGETYLVGPDYSLVTPNWGLTQIGAQGVQVRTTATERAVGAQQNGSGLYNNYQGVAVVGSYRWLPSLGAAMLAEQELGETSSTVQTVLLINLAVALGAVLLALGAGMLITRSIARPLSSLAETSSKIAAGDLALSAEVQREDEIGILAAGFNRMTRQLRELISGLEQRVTERTAALEQRSKYLQASAEVGQAVASILDVEGLIKQVVELIRDRFDLYYVGMFLLDESGEWAVLHAGTGEAGQALLARGHRRRVGEGMIGWSVEHGEARIALDVGDDAVRLATAELPETRSEAALPLRSRGRVLGALTVQSAQPAAFDKDSLVVLQTMAEQVAVALDNARLFAASQEAVEAAGRAYGEVSQRGWAQMVRARPDLAFRSDERGVTSAAQIWRPEMERAMEMGQAEAGEAESSDKVPLAVPIKVRGEVIGVLDTYRPSDEGAWSTQEVALFEAIADQLGTALESARLYHDTQRRAVQERLIGEVTARMRETLDVEAVVKTAADEIYKALELDQVVIRLVPTPEGDGRDRRQPVQPSSDADLTRGEAQA
jgi:GAF domain-containing protein/HAMP domain-containing protein